MTISGDHPMFDKLLRERRERQGKQSPKDELIERMDDPYDDFLDLLEDVPRNERYMFEYLTPDEERFEEQMSKDD